MLSKTIHVYCQQRSSHHSDILCIATAIQISAASAGGHPLCCFTIGGIGASSQWFENKKDEDEALYALEKGQQYLESKPLMMFLAIAIKVY